MGLGGVKFAFPRLVLYENNGYHECPSHWTRLTYEWEQLSNGEPKFMLKDENIVHECTMLLTRPGRGLKQAMATRPRSISPLAS